MGFFNQRKDTVEWQEYRPDVLFYKWPNTELKRGSTLIVRPGQKAIFYAGGRIEGVFEAEGTYDVETQIVPFLSTLSGVFTLRKDTGLRAEIYFVNAKELTMNWGTRQRLMIPTREAPAGVPVGMNGNLTVEFRDYLRFISKIAGVRGTYTLSDVAERVLGEMNEIVAEAVLDGAASVELNALIALQSNSRRLSEKIAEELDKELFEIGLGVCDVSIMSVNYPPQVQQMVEKTAAQSFVTDPAKYAAIAMADGMEHGGAGGSFAAMGAQAVMGAQLARQMQQTMQDAQAPAPQAPPSQTAAPQPDAPQPAGQGDRFCPKCRKMVQGRFCSDCGTQTV